MATQEIISIPTSIRVDGRDLKFSAIHSRFADTEPGRVLAARSRWDRYKPDFVPNERWEALFGPDVNNLDHNALVRRQAGNFFYRCQNLPAGWQGTVPEDAAFTWEEQTLVMLHANGHDWQEAYMGDVMHDLKTEEFRRSEEEEYLVLTSNIFGGDSDKKLLKRLHQAAGIVENKSTKLGRAFNAIERIGFLTTGLRAWEKSHDPENADIQGSLEWMASNAIGNQVTKLIEKAHIYPPVFHILNENSETISEALADMPPGVFGNYTDETERLAQEEKFTNSRASWGRYMR